METPTRRSTRGRKSTAPNGDLSSTDASPSSSQILDPKSSKKAATSNGSASSPPGRRGRPSKQKPQSGAVDRSELEFLGLPGVSAIMILSPLVMYYMWLGATYYDGKLPWPRKNESWSLFARLTGQMLYTGAFPTLRAWVIYWVFLIFQVVCYMYLPGIYAKGKQLEWEGGKRLDYYCSGVWSFYVTIITAITLHVTRIFRLDTVIDEFGPIMSVAVISGFAVSVIAYVSAVWRGRQHRMTGWTIYDFFMGAEINPRLFGQLDLKMFFEVRLPWYILLLISMGAAARQWERYGFVSGEVAFLVFAHFLYANACSKGEELIVTSW